MLSRLLSDSVILISNVNTSHMAITRWHNLFDLSNTIFSHIQMYDFLGRFHQKLNGSLVPRAIGQPKVPFGTHLNTAVCDQISINRLPKIFQLLTSSNQLRPSSWEDIRWPTTVCSKSRQSQQEWLCVVIKHHLNVNSPTATVCEGLSGCALLHLTTDRVWPKQVHHELSDGGGGGGGGGGAKDLDGS